MSSLGIVHGSSDAQSSVEFRLDTELGDWTQNSAKHGSLLTDCHRFSDSCIYTVELRLERKLGPWSQIVTDSVTVVYIYIERDIDIYYRV